MWIEMGIKLGAFYTAIYRKMPHQCKTLHKHKYFFHLSGSLIHVLHEDTGKLWPHACNLTPRRMIKSFSEILYLMVPTMSATYPVAPAPTCVTHPETNRALSFFLSILSRSILIIISGVVGG